MPSEFSMIRKVEFADTDMAGIMHFAHFYRWMEVCEHEFLRSVGLSVHMKTEEAQIGWPRVNTSCHFKRPLRFEDEVEICLRVREMRDRSIVYAFEFWKEENGDRVRAAAGETVAACVRFDPATHAMSPVAIPEAFREKIQALPDEELSEGDG